MPDQYQTLYRPEFEHDACGVGFVARKTGQAGHDILQLALEAVGRMEHRSAIDADGLSGDGAGILTQIPHKLLAAEIDDLPEPGDYALGMLFLPQRDGIQETDAVVEWIKLTLNSSLSPTGSQSKIENRQSKIIWRSVPINPDSLGQTARRTRPAIKQIIIRRPPHVDRGPDFERFLFTVRKHAGGSGS